MKRILYFDRLFACPLQRAFHSCFAPNLPVKKSTGDVSPTINTISACAVYLLCTWSAENFPLRGNISACKCILTLSKTFIRDQQFSLSNVFSKKLFVRSENTYQEFSTNTQRSCPRNSLHCCILRTHQQCQLTKIKLTERVVVFEIYHEFLELF